MELNHLRYLRAVVRAGSVTVAAENEYVSQPSVSKQLKALERELRVALFHRVGRRVVPTDAALALSDCADRVFDDLAATLASISGPDSFKGGSLRMCATETASDQLLPRVLTELYRRHPKCKIRVEMLGTDASVAQVLADEVDLALVVLPLADSRLDVHELLTEEVMLAAPLDHPWAKRKVVSLQEVLEEPNLLLSMPGHGLRALVDEAAQQLQVEVAGRVELRSLAALLAIVAAGGGVVLTPRMSVIGRKDVVALPIEPRLCRRLGWIKRRGRHMPAIGVELLRLLGESAEALD